MIDFSWFRCLQQILFFEQTQWRIVSLLVCATIECYRNHCSLSAAMLYTCSFFSGCQVLCRKQSRKSPEGHSVAFCRINTFNLMNFIHWVIKQSLRKLEKWFYTLVLNNKIMYFQNQGIVWSQIYWIEISSPLEEY